ncbi:hypothetical protein ACLOJK_036339 [Asimina triloba]
MSLSKSNDACSSVTIQAAIIQSQYVPPEPNSSYEEIIIAATNDIGVERIIKEIPISKGNNHVPPEV